MVALNLNTNTYVIGISNLSASATLTPLDANQSSVVLYNGSTTAVFVVSGNAASAPTAVYPTSATVPLAGKVIGPGVTTTFTKNAGDRFISAIQATSGTGNLYIAPGTGE